MTKDFNGHRNLVELLHHLAHKAPSGKSFTQISELMNKSYSGLSSELNTGLETHKFGAGDLLLLMELTDSDVPIHFLAARRNGVFIKLPSISAKGPVDQASIKVIKEFGELMATYAEALEDGSIDKQDRRDILKEGYEAIESIMSLMKHVENMEE